MTSALDPKQIVSFEELLMSQTIQLEAVTRLLVEKGIFNKEEFLEMVKRGKKWRLTQQCRTSHSGFQ
jgi:hypothetical protein